MMKTEMDLKNRNLADERLVLLVYENHEFCIQSDEFCVQNDEFVFEMMGFVFGRRGRAFPLICKVWTRPLKLLVRIRAAVPGGTAPL